jgi:branched-subunit amino acid transport protein
MTTVPMDWLYLALACAGLTAATLLTRGSFFMLPSRWQLPPRLERALRYAPACALAAIIAPEVLLIQGDVSLALANDKLWATVLAAAVFIKTRNMLLMMAVGMIAFTLLRLYV